MGGPPERQSAPRPLLRQGLARTLHLEPSDRPGAKYGKNSPEPRTALQVDSRGMTVLTVVSSGSL